MELKENMFIPLVRLEVVREKTIPYYCETPINCPEKIAEWIRPMIQNSDREIVVVVSLDAACHPVAVEAISVGDISSAIVSSREVFKNAVISNCYGIVLLHNHPSAAPAQPSDEDILVTQKLKRAADFLDIELFDSLVIGSDGSIAKIPID